MHITDIIRYVEEIVYSLIKSGTSRMHIKSTIIEEFVSEINEKSDDLTKEDRHRIGQLYVSLREHMFFDSYLSFTERTNDVDILSLVFLDDFDDSIYEKENDIERLKYIDTVSKKISTVELFRSFSTDLPGFNEGDANYYGDFEDLMSQIKRSIEVVKIKIEAKGELDNFWIHPDGKHVPMEIDDEKMFDISIMEDFSTHRASIIKYNIVRNDTMNSFNNGSTPIGHRILGVKTFVSGLKKENPSLGAVVPFSDVTDEDIDLFM